MTNTNHTTTEREEQLSYLAQRLSIVTPMLNRFAHISSKEAGLRSPRDLFLLTLLSKHPVNQVHITKILEINAPTLSKQIDALVQAGLIERTTSEEDRRSQLLTITPVGSEKLVEFQDISKRRLKEILTAASDTELADINQAATVLTKLISERIASVHSRHKHHCHEYPTTASGDAHE